MPAYWLGAFFYPRGLLALVKQDCYKQQTNERSGNFDQYIFQTEITARDKDHVRPFLFPFHILAIALIETTTGSRFEIRLRKACSSSASTSGGARGRRQLASSSTSLPSQLSRHFRSSTWRAGQPMRSRCFRILLRLLRRTRVPFTTRVLQLVSPSWKSTYRIPVFLLRSGPCVASPLPSDPSNTTNPSKFVSRITVIGSRQYWHDSVIDFSCYITTELLQE